MLPNKPQTRPEPAPRRAPEAVLRPETERSNAAVQLEEAPWETQAIVLHAGYESAPAQAAPQVKAAPAQRPAVVAPPSLVNDEWRRWIAENLLLDAPPDGLVRAMFANGIPQEEAVKEVELAMQSPYIIGAERLRNRLRKRDWILATYRKGGRLHPDATEIHRRERLSRNEFLRDYYSINHPVLITGMMDDWPALQKWNLDYFADRFGNREIEVQSGRKAGDNYEVEREKYLKRMTMSEYVRMIRSAGVTNDFYLTANNNSFNKRVLPELWDDVVQIPEYLDGRDRTGGFFWFGPAGTITPFHHDLTNNFMAQVIGRKLVKLVPSWDMPLMNNQLHCFSNVDGRVVPPSPAPSFDAPQIIECVLNPGEILFLPIGWMHFVEGLDVSVTMSFTNFVFDNDFASFYTTYHAV